MKLEEYKLKIAHVPGKANLMTDLSFLAEGAHIPHENRGRELYAAMYRFEVIKELTTLSIEKMITLAIRGILMK